MSDWQRTKVAPDGTHHLLGDTPFYETRWNTVGKFHVPGLAPASGTDGALHIGVDGRPAYARRFVRTFGFYEGLAAVEDHDDWHHVRPDGGEAYPTRWAWCGNLQGGRVPVRDREGRYRHIDTSGCIRGGVWRYAGDFRDGLAVVMREDGRSTHVGLGGEVLHGRWFLDLDVFHKGYARARDEAGWTHVDAGGRPVYDARFAMVEPFYNGQARVERFDGALQVIDERGEVRVVLREGIERRGEETPVRPLDSPEPLLLLLRHGARGPIPVGEPGGEVPLLPEGVESARALGGRIGGRLVHVRTSPVLRCVETADAIADGAGRHTLPTPDHLLGAPGVFVVDPAVAWKSWERLGPEGVMAALVAGEHLPGLAPPAAAAVRLVAHMVACAAGRSGVHVFVTHDSLLVATIAHTVGGPLPREEWPGFLEALAVSPSKEFLTLRWRDRTRVLPWP